MASPKTIFWEVDVQADFMLPGGNLYVPSAETIIANIRLLVDAAQQARVLLISSADTHNPDDFELREWPPHCLKGTRGAELLPEACAEPRLIIPNQKGFVLPHKLEAYRPVTLEKNTIRCLRQSQHRRTYRIAPPVPPPFSTKFTIRRVRSGDRTLCPVYRSRSASS